MNKKKALSLALIFALAMQIFAMPFAQTAAAAPKAAKTAKTVKAVKKGLQRTGKKLYFYKNGKKLKNKWRNANGYRYYFGKDGAAYTGYRKVEGSWYYFDKKTCRMYREKIVKIKGGRYYFMANGKAAKRAVMLKNGKVWRTNSGGKLMENITKYAKANKDYNAFRGKAGAPLKSQRQPGCNPVGSYDGMYTYDNFQVVTVEMNGSKKIVDVLEIANNQLPPQI